jgi:hypothetical protein
MSIDGIDGNLFMTARLLHPTNHGRRLAQRLRSVNFVWQNSFENNRLVGSAPNDRSLLYGEYG